MHLKVINNNFSICKIEDLSSVDLSKPFVFLAKTDEEISLVCSTEDVPKSVIEQNDGWKAIRIEGTLDFSLIGILAKITTLLADHHISVFVVSTFNTDYILVKEENLQQAITALEEAGYQFIES